MNGGDSQTGHQDVNNCMSNLIGNTENILSCFPKIKKHLLFQQITFLPHMRAVSQDQLFFATPKRVLEQIQFFGSIG